MHSLPAFFLQGTAPVPGGASPTVFFVQIAVIFAIFYFIVMRPQRKQQKLLEEWLLNLSKGDEVTTAGGLIGDVVHMGTSLKDGAPSASMGDRVTIRSGESKVVIERGRITRVSKKNEG